MATSRGARTHFPRVGGRATFYIMWTSCPSAHNHTHAHAANITLLNTVRNKGYLKKEQQQLRSIFKFQKFFSTNSLWSSEVRLCCGVGNWGPTTVRLVLAGAVSPAALRPVSLRVRIYHSDTVRAQHSDTVTVTVLVNHTNMNHYVKIVSNFTFVCQLKYSDLRGRVIRFFFCIQITGR